MRHLTGSGAANGVLLDLGRSRLYTPPESHRQPEARLFYAFVWQWSQDWDGDYPDYDVVTRTVLRSPQHIATLRG
jgi:hypothetical protein